MERRATNPLLRRLDVLVGEWRAQASVGGRVVGGSRTRFEWIEGGAFLAEHDNGEPPPPGAPREWIENVPFPVTTITGLDDSAERFTTLYADARGVFRVYQATMADGVWTAWREAPGFSQRFTGTFSDDGNTIKGRWERSSDGSTWEKDFDITYTKVT